MSQIPLRSVRLNARPASTLQSFVGTAGEIFYDSTNQTLRVYPGNSAGGKILADRDWVNSAIGDIESSSLVNGARTVSLSSTGSLTIPGDIRSEGNINIDINLSDSTLRRWQFGEDGQLTFPDGTNQSTAWLGAGTPVYTNLIDSLDSSAIIVTPSTIFNSDVTVENDLLVKNITLMTGGGGSTIKEGLAPNLAGGAIILTPAFSANENQALVIYPTAAEGNHIHLSANGGTTELYLGDDSQYVKLVNDGNVEVRSTTSGSTAAWTFGTAGSLTFPDSTVQSTAWTGSLNNPTFTGTTTLQQITEVMSPKTGATGVVEHDFSTAAIFYHTSPAANFTINITNVPTTVNRVTTVVLIITQGVTGYYPNVLQIGGNAQTINWIGNVTPTPSASRNDIVSFTLIRTDAPSWIVTGAITGY